MLKSLSQNLETFTNLVSNRISSVSMKPEFIEVKKSLEECPKCGKHSLAQQGQDKYHCLWCGFYRDISPPQGRGLLLMATIIVLVVLVLQANQGSFPRNQVSPADSPVVSQ